ncbi:MAG: hypothetical protein ACOCV3_08130 [Halanaerobiales bacterium]
MGNKERSLQELKETAENKEKEKPKIEAGNKERFNYIAGYTSGGAPYGINLKECETENEFLDGESPF